MGTGRRRGGGERQSPVPAAAAGGGLRGAAAGGGAAAGPGRGRRGGSAPAEGGPRRPGARSVAAPEGRLRWARAAAAAANPCGRGRERGTKLSPSFSFLPVPAPCARTAAATRSVPEPCPAGSRLHQQRRQQRRRLQRRRMQHRPALAMLEGSDVRAARLRSGGSGGRALGGRRAAGTGGGGRLSPPRGRATGGAERRRHGEGGAEMAAGTGELAEEEEGQRFPSGPAALAAAGRLRKAPPGLAPGREARGGAPCSAPRPRRAEGSLGCRTSPAAT